jgi:serine/threonine protein kinase
MLVLHTGGTHAIAGSLNYMSPEMLLSYPQHTTSTDMWSGGCVLGAMLLNKTTLFEGTNAINQLHNIARVRVFVRYSCVAFLNTPVTPTIQVLGTDGLLDASTMYNWAFNSSIIHARIPAKDWATMVPPERAAYATPDALDLLSRLLR